MIFLAVTAVAILVISGAITNELFPGTTSRMYFFAHRVPLEQDGRGTEYDIGRVNIVHRNRLIKPLGAIGFAVEGEQPVTLIGFGASPGEPSATIRSMIDARFPQVPPEIRDAWAQSVTGLVQRAVHDGPDAARAYSNQDRDATTFSYPIPESGIPIPEEVFRQGRVVIYPPSQRIAAGNYNVSLAVWVLTTALLAAAVKLIANAIRRRHPEADSPVVLDPGRLRSEVP